MANIALPIKLITSPLLAAEAPGGLHVLRMDGRCDLVDATATMVETAVDKTTTGEAPHPNARVAVLRLIDFRKVWEGFADADGKWQADGLQPGFEYVAVGIDQQRIYKATAAGPVTATVPADGATGGGNG